MPVDLVNVVHKETGRKARIARAALRHYPAFRPTASQDASDAGSVETTTSTSTAPARNASKADWVAHAVSLGVDPQEADGLTRDELAELYTPTAQEA